MLHTWLGWLHIGAVDGRKPRIASIALIGAAILILLIIAYSTRSVADNIVALFLLALAGASIALLSPSLDPALVDRPMAPLIAFVGCDGSGKSTLTSDIYRELSGSRLVQTCYLGLGSGTIGERIKRWPLIGAAVERRLMRKANQARTEGSKIPGLATAIVIYGFSLLRLRRFNRMLRLRRRGIIVLTDRYPQIEVAGIYDGPGLSAATPTNWLVADLARRERRIYAWMAKFRPDVIVRLNVDAETALARKPDHRADLVSRKVALTPVLRFSGARIVDLDARNTYGTVRDEVARIVSDVLAS